VALITEGFCHCICHNIKLKKDNLAENPKALILVIIIPIFNVNMDACGEIFPPTKH